MRRTIFISVLAILLIGIGVVAYFYFFTGSASLIATTPTENATLPIVGQGTPPTTGTSAADAASVGAPTVVSSRLVKISAGPVVPGEVVVDTSVASSSEVSVTYIERRSGNVYSYSSRTEAITRINNQTLPGIQSAQWLPDATVAFVRYLSGTDSSTINTYALRASGGQGYFLSQNLADVAVSSTSILTLASGVNGSVASIGRPSDAQLTEVFSTPLSALRASFAGKQYLAYTKPAASLPGYAFLVDIKGTFSRIAGPLNGLVVQASHSGKWVLVSYVQNDALQMGLVNTTTNEKIPLPVATIADKCVWVADDSVIYCGIPVSQPSGFAYPDDWYQGVVSFNDRIWKIDVTGRYAQLVLDFPKETGGSLDATALAINPNNTELVFLNKTDGSLWGYQL